MDKKDKVIMLRWYFFLNIHLQPMCFAHLGKFVMVQELFFLIQFQS